jgi:hypothetical protein
MRTQDLRVIELSGTARQRGRIYGESERSRIESVLGRWFAHLEHLHRIPAASYIAEFLAGTDFVSAIRRETPHLLEEIEGIAEGAGVAASTVLALNLMDEEWWFGNRRLAQAQGDSGDHCSALAITGQPGLPTYLAQNMDIAPWTDEHQVLLRVRYPESDLESLVFTFSGMLALNGMNRAGLGVCCNTLSQLRPSVEGLPVVFVVRAILERQSFQDAVDFVRGVRHASGQNYTIGSPDRVVSLECSASRIAHYVPGEDANRVWHTNHPFVNDDRIGRETDTRTSTPSNSEIRYTCLTRRIGAPGTRITPELIKDTLRSHDDPDNPVSRPAHPGDPFRMGFTAGSTIFVLGDDPYLELAAGPPCQSEYRTFRFSRRERAPVASPREPITAVSDPELIHG